tara:strand:+ start:696 stop:2237 length:1542 start_codon:yes stop_codon:yes gene_type:complete
MAIKGYESKKNQVDSLTNIIKLFTALEDDKGTRDEVKFNAGATSDLIKLTNTIEGMEKLQGIVNEQDAQWDSLGYDTVGDINKEAWSNKFNIMQSGQSSVKYLSGDFFNITDVDAKTNEILDMSWSELSNMWQKVNEATYNIAEAKKLGMRFKDNGDVLSLSKATQFDTMFKNSLNILAAQGVWEIPEEFSEMAESEFGVAMMTYDQPTFMNFMKNKESLSRSNVNKIEGQMEIFFNNMINAQAKGGSSNATVGMETFGMTEGNLYKADEYRAKYEDYKTLLQTLNERHNNLYGNYASETPSALGTEGEGGGGSWLDGDVVKVEGAKKEDENTKDDKAKDTFNDEDKQLVSPPKYSISLDASTKIEKTISKVLKSNEYDKSVKTSNFKNVSTGEDIDIVKYDKNYNIYTDSKGNKFSRDQIAVVSIDDIKPNIKIANGEPYYFNPMTNKIEKWGSNENYKKQKIEKMVINGKSRNIPVIQLDVFTQDKGNKLYWLDGKWKPLGKAPYKPSWQK